MFEKVAEEYAEEHKEVDWEGFDKNKEELKQAFLAGLKAGRPQWHDLRKNPNNLPDDTYDVLDQAGYKVHYNFFQNVWVNEKDEIDEHVIAWCEIPKFTDKELDK
jgi:hypothetical protein